MLCLQLKNCKVSYCTVSKGGGQLGQSTPPPSPFVSEIRWCSNQQTTNVGVYVSCILEIIPKLFCVQNLNCCPAPPPQAPPSPFKHANTLEVLKLILRSEILIFQSAPT